jgi:putative glutathione S-transferase
MLFLFGDHFLANCEVIMSKLKNSWKTSINDGQFRRRDSEFRHTITADANGKFPAEKDRYHLFVSLACPWAHRTLIFRKLKGLEDIITVSVVHPDMLQQGWSFSHDAKSAELYGTTGDSLYGANYLFEHYFTSNPEYSGAITVPVLWDKKNKVIVNNESSEIIRMFNSAFNHITGNTLDFYPEHLRENIEHLNALVYDNINNGVYKTGFATTQAAYEENCQKLFDALAEIDQKLASNRYLAGNQITEADWRLFPTLVRFDAVYHTHFKCNVNLLQSYRNIYNYMLELYQIDGIADTINMEHIKRHYFYSHQSLNPYGIVATGPAQDWTLNHNRHLLS